MVYAQADRLRSYELVADVWGLDQTIANQSADRLMPA
jgi:hypothetical protein